jgi:hypothetical protein
LPDWGGVPYDQVKIRRAGTPNCPPIMSTTARKLLSHLLVALYGSVAILGYGLHELAPESGHHHHGLAHLGRVCGHGHVHSEGCHQEHKPLTAETTKHVYDSDECDVCVFLDQLRSEETQVQSAEVRHEFVAAVAHSEPQFHHPTSLGLHVARGPPAILVG